jgi:hypothetical protein
MSTKKDQETKTNTPQRTPEPHATQGPSELPTAIPDYPPPTSTEPPPTLPD